MGYQSGRRLYSCTGLRRHGICIDQRFLFSYQACFIISSISRLHKKILDVATEPKPVRLVTKPYVNGVVPFQSRSFKLVEKFSELYKNDRVQILNSLKGIPDSSTAERFVFLIVEVRQMNYKSLQLVEVESRTALALLPRANHFAPGYQYIQLRGRGGANCHDLASHPHPPQVITKGLTETERSGSIVSPSRKRDPMCL